MHYRKLGNTNWDVSEIGFGGWALGGQWGGQDDNGGPINPSFFEAWGPCLRFGGATEAIRGG